MEINGIVLTIIKISSIIALLLGNAFFVISEFAIVKVRLTRIEALALKGDFRAKIAENILKNTNAYLSAAQVGITMTSLGLGWLGEPVVAELIKPLLTPLGIVQPHLLEVIAFTLGFSFITASHIVIGEMAPKAFAIQYSEASTLWTSVPFRAFYLVFYPLIWLLNEASNKFLLLLHLPPPPEGELGYTTDELRRVVKESSESGELSKDGAQMMQRVLTFTTRTVKDIMVPRTNIMGLEIHASPEAILDSAIECGYSRMPVYDGTLDQIVGVVYMKDFLATEESRELIHLSDITRNTYFIPETMKVGQLLKDFQKRKIHMAIVVDEYGVTTGLVTLEDVIEEIVGEIQDEYDTEEERIQKMADGSLVVDATMNILDLSRYQGVQFPEGEEYESLGGFFLSRFGKIPTGGESIAYKDQTFIVADVDKHRIRKVKIIFKPKTS